jgi:hypothetical protein
MIMHCILIAVTLSLVLSQAYAINFGLPPLPGFGTGNFIYEAPEWSFLSSFFLTYLKGPSDVRSCTV